MSGTGVGKLLGLGQPAVSRAVVRVEKLTQGYEFKLNKMRNAFFHVRILPRRYVDKFLINRCY